MTQDTLTIRRAATGDAATLHRFVSLLEAHVDARTTMPATVADFARALSAVPPVMFAELLERQGVPVAAATWYPVFSTSLGCGGIFVLDLFVEEGERGRGHGGRLLAHMAALARERGDGFLKLEVDRSNDAAAAVYTRLGFTPSSSHPQLLMGEALAHLAARAHTQ